MKVRSTTAAILAESGKPLIVDQMELPEELAAGQVLVQIRYSGICGAQINEIDAVKGPDRWLPHLLGHEAVGEVLEIGPGVTTVSPRDSVILHWRPSAGIQSATPSYRWRDRTLNAGWVTTFNRHCVVSENRLTLQPPGLDDRIAPLFGCAVTTAMGVINHDAQVRLGESVVVFGVGGVGLNVAQAAAMVSGHPVVAVDLQPAKVEMAKRYGATHGLVNAGMSDLEVADAIRAIVGPGGADVIVETTGVGKIIELAYDLTHKDGRTILVGVPRDKVQIYTLPLHFRKILTGSEGGSCQPHLDIPRYAKLVAAGKLDLEGIVTHTFPLHSINEGLDLVRSGNAGRVLIEM